MDIKGITAGSRGCQRCERGPNVDVQGADNSVRDRGQHGGERQDARDDRCGFAIAGTPALTNRCTTCPTSRRPSPIRW